jgi:hypothetical protein
VLAGFKFRSHKFNLKNSLCIFLLAILSNATLALQGPEIPDADAQSVRLVVSAAQDPAQQSHFFGAQIVQIVIDDPGARDPDKSTSGLIVKGVNTPRVHLGDGQWYSFMAEDDSFLVLLDVLTDGVRDSIISVSNLDDADNRNTLGQYNIEFGNADSFVREITDFGGSTFIEVSKNAIFPTLPEPFVGSAINPDLDINPSDEAESDWPYIRLLNIQESDIVEIRHSTESVSLTFASLYNFIQSSLDRESYPTDSEIIMTFNDFMWNINPVEEDVVRFVLDKNTGNPIRVIYEPIRNFDPDGQGLTGENLADVLSVFGPLEFDSRQLLEVQGVANLKYKEVFDNGIVEFPETTGRLISAFSAASQSPMVTFFERDPNTSRLTTADDMKGGRSTIFAGIRDTTASFDYFDIIDTAAIGLSDAITAADKEIYISGERGTFSVTDQDLNSRANVSEQPDGILSKAFLLVGNPFPITNNAVFNTLPKSGTGFTADSIKEVRFQSGTSVTAEESVNLPGVADFFSMPGHSEGLNPPRTDLLALQFTTDGASGTSGAAPTGIVVNTNVRIADIDDVIAFSMTKEELQAKTDPFILSVSKLADRTSPGTSFTAAPPTDLFEVQFPKYNLISIDLRKVQGTFARVFVEVSVHDGGNEVAGSSQIVDFEPFDPDDLDGNPFTLSIDPLMGAAGIGSFRVLDIIAALPPNANLNNLMLKFTVIITDSVNTPLPLTATTHTAVLDVAGLGVVRAEGLDKDQITVNAFANFVYRLALDEEGENSPRFSGRADFMTMLHDDKVQRVLSDIVILGDPLKVWLPNRFIPPNRLTFSYTDIDVTGNLRQVSTTFIYETRDGVISWDKGQYRFSQVAYLTITDADLNRRPDAVEQYTMPLDGFIFLEFDKRRIDTKCTTGTPNCFVNQIESTLRETGPNTGAFRAQITIPQNVLLEDGDTIKTFQSDIQATYVDARDSSSNVQQFDARAVIRSDINTAEQPQEHAPDEPVVAGSGSMKLELNKGNYHPYDRVIMTIIDQSGNKDIFHRDVIFVSAKRQAAATGLLSYKLVETDVNTSTFIGYIDLRGNTGVDGGNGPRDGTLRIFEGDTLHVSYVALSVDIPVQYHDAKIFWGKTRYVVGEKAVLHVIDSDMNKDADRIELIHVQLQVGIVKTDVELRETDLSTGVFMAEVPFVDLASVMAGTVGVKSGDTVVATYNDDTAPESSIKATGLSGNVLPMKASVAVGDELELVGTERVTQTEVKVVDEKGREAAVADFRSIYSIESRISNNTTEALNLEVIVQIRDEEGITQFIGSIEKELASKDTYTSLVEWQAMKRGRLIIEIFVWEKNVFSPLSPVKKISLSVV